MVNFLSNKCCDELVHRAFQFLKPQELAVCRIVDKRFRDIADSHNLYAVDDYAIKLLYNQYVAQLPRPITENTLVSDHGILNHWPDDLIYHVFSFLKPAELGTCQKVSHRFQQIADQSGLSSEARELKALYGMYRRSRDFYYYLYLVGNGHALGRDGILTKIHDGGFASREFDLTRQRADILYEKYMTKRSDFLMMSLFGGRKNFEKLPVLDIGTRVGRTGYIDFIKPHEMTAPIMRGKDRYGREFVSFKIADQQDKTRVFVQTFFHRSSGNSNWTYGGDTVICLQSPYLIEDGRIRDREAYGELKLLLSGKHSFGELTS